MVSILSLWLPIILSAVIVFIASSILHMVLKYHRSEYRRLPDEDEIMEAVRKQNAQPGFYAFPHAAAPSDMNSPQVKEKFQRGPVGHLTIIPSGIPAMGKYLTMWFLYSLMIGIFVAYLAGRTMSVGSDYLSIFRIAGTVAFLGYGVGHIVDSIWKGQKWSATLKHVLDGFIYALLTAGVFGWLWPR